MRCGDPNWWDMFRRSVSRARTELRHVREFIACAHLPVATSTRNRFRRLAQGERLEPRTLFVSALFQVNAFETWNADPQVIRSTDPAGVAYHSPSGNLFIADSEINELAEFDGSNVFEVNRTGEKVYREEWPGGNSEPTGITWNEGDGFFYITNDDERTVTRFDPTLTTPLGSVKTRPLGVGDPEDITSDPAGHLYVVNGHPPLVGVFDAEFNFIRQFSTAEKMTDAEGIAYNKQNNHLFLVSAVDQRIFEYTVDGGFVTDYPLDYLDPPPQTPQGLTFAPCTDKPSIECLFIADGGIDNEPDGQIYEVRVGRTRPPITRDESISLPEDTSVEIALTASDADGDPLVYSIETGPIHGILSGAAPNLTYSPHWNFHGTDSITFRVFDGWVASQLATVSITVQSVNDPPVTTNPSLTTELGFGLPIELDGADPDEDPLSYSILSSPNHGQIAGTAPDLFYFPDPGFKGLDTIVYQVSDPSGEQVHGTVTIRVRASDDPVTEIFQEGQSPTSDYAGTQDTKIRGDWPSRDYGTSTLLEVDGKPDIASLLRWDLSAIPVGSVVQSVSLSIHVINPSSDAFDIRRMLRPWNETTATFLTADSTTEWERSGITGASDRDPTVLGKLTAPAAGPTTIEWNSDGVAAVQYWIENPSLNYGFVMENYDDSSTDSLEFSSSDHEDATLRPSLSVVFVPPSKSRPLTNPVNQYDVNADLIVSPGDALVVINRIHSNQIVSSAAGEDTDKSTSYPDVSGDKVVSPLDVLLIFNYLNKGPNSSAEGESPDYPFEAELRIIANYAIYLLDPKDTSRPQFLPFNSARVHETESTMARTRPEQPASVGPIVDRESCDSTPELNTSGEDLEWTARRNERSASNRRAAVFADWPDRSLDDSGDW